MKHTRASLIYLIWAAEARPWAAGRWTAAAGAHPSHLRTAKLLKISASSTVTCPSQCPSILHQSFLHIKVNSSYSCIYFLLGGNQHASCSLHAPWLETVWDVEGWAAATLGVYLCNQLKAEPQQTQRPRHTSCLQHSLCPQQPLPSSPVTLDEEL